eukprot:TCALIF_06242-PA protein Name:"Similar to PLA2G15 Group XV phospholipase A2 (Homo sapiens)" AED:0.10 eAED:0.10 QI:0/0/0/0.8/1/1/5/0/408
MIPGDGGSQIEARLNKTSSPHYMCAKKSDWFDLWLNIELMMPSAISCWADNMRLMYDKETHTSHSPPGVETRVVGWGNVSSVEYIDPSQNGYSVYFHKIADRLRKLGYKSDKNLYGAPYDFRKAPNELADFFTNMKTLVEKAYGENDNTPVILICHSMGAPNMLYFLNRQKQAWKDKYIRAMVTLAGVWAGTVRAMKVFAVGDNLGAWLISTDSIKIEERSNPSLAFLMPSEKLWSEDEILVESDNVNFTVKNISEFFNGYAYPDMSFMREDTKDLVKDLKAPGVEVYCLHGASVPTTERMVYRSFPASGPNLIYGDGDGTVNMRSLVACNKWSQEQRQPVHHLVLPHIDHLAILTDSHATEAIKKVIISITGERETSEVLEDVQNEEESARRPFIPYPGLMPRIDIV